MGGRDPYSASKGCAELVTAAYRESYFADGAAVASARAGNVIGGGDWAPIGSSPTACVRWRPASPSSFGTPRPFAPGSMFSSRCRGTSCWPRSCFRDGHRFEGSWNFGPTETSGARPVRWVVDRVVDEWDSGSWTTPADAGRQPHEAHHLSLDSSKAREQLGWAPVWDAQTAVHRTASWYRDYYRAPRTARQMVRAPAPGLRGRCRGRRACSWAAVEPGRIG